MRRNLLLLLIGLSLAAPARQCSALCVNVAQANLRTGPGTDYMKSWEVGKYMPFEKIGISLSGDWYAVKDVDGDTHWIHKKLLDEDCRSAVATGDNIAIRKGPGLNYGKTRLGRVSKYYCFQILEQKSNWIHVRDALKNKGWMHKKNLWIP